MVGNFSTVLFFCEITRYNGMTIFKVLDLHFPILCVNYMSSHILSTNFMKCGIVGRLCEFVFFIFKTTEWCLIEFGIKYVQ